MKAKRSGAGCIHFFTLGDKTLDAREWEATGWCKARKITAPMLRTRRDCGWNDTEALTVPKVKASEIATYRKQRETKQELSTPDFYALLHKIAVDYGVN